MKSSLRGRVYTDTHNNNPFDLLTAANENTQNTQPPLSTLPPHVVRMDQGGEQIYAFVLPASERPTGWPAIMPLGTASTSSLSGLLARAWEIYASYIQAALHMRMPNAPSQSTQSAQDQTGDQQDPPFNANQQDTSMAGLIHRYTLSHDYADLPLEERRLMRARNDTILDWHTPDVDTPFRANTFVDIVQHAPDPLTPIEVEEHIFKILDTDAGQDFLQTLADQGHIIPPHEPSTRQSQIYMVAHAPHNPFAPHETIS